MEEVKEIPVIGIAQVLQMLKDGKTREEVRVHYGITKTDLKNLFKHPELIGKKTIKPKAPKAPTFTIVADEVGTVDVKVEDIEVKDEVKVEATMKIVDDTDVKEVGQEGTDSPPVVEEEKKSTWT